MFAFVRRHRQGKTTIKPHHHVVAAAEAPTSRQRLFTRYLLSIFVDLVVLSLFAEYWSRVTVENFSTALIAAVLLQLLLQATLAVEHRVAQLFEARSGALWTAIRFFCAWLILFGSKFVMLGAIDRVLGDAVHFAGALHGVLAFLVVVAAMLVAEELLIRIHRKLA
ncbi:MAG: hypothetical protein AAF098_15555 [Pseudomonadota bacterium]